jgi:hypothetical protein
VDLGSARDSATQLAAGLHPQNLGFRVKGRTLAGLAGPLGTAPPGALVSAAPDAYGYLLPGRAQRTLRPGARGLVLLDAAQRAYAPGLTACGTAVARIGAGHGFQRPDGGLDRGRATLVRGTVVAAGTTCPG